MQYGRSKFEEHETIRASRPRDVADLFDREANVFATEVLFQLDNFINETNDQEFGIFVPVRTSKKYGASTN